MGFEHTKGRRVSPRNLRMLPVRKSCRGCGLLDELYSRKKIGESIRSSVWDCRRPDGPKYDNLGRAALYVCDGHRSE